ncbi:hypothetical protein MPH_14237, partial [Macrophomina phaseolina MS6]
YPGSVQKIPNR